MLVFKKKNISGTEVTNAMKMHGGIEAMLKYRFLLLVQCMVKTQSMPNDWKNAIAVLFLT